MERPSTRSSGSKPPPRPTLGRGAPWGDLSDDPPDLRHSPDLDDDIPPLPPTPLAGGAPRGDLSDDPPDLRHSPGLDDDIPPAREDLGSKRGPE